MTLLLLCQCAVGTMNLQFLRATVRGVSCEVVLFIFIIYLADIAVICFNSYRYCLLIRRCACIKERMAICVSAYYLISSFWRA